MSWDVQVTCWQSLLPQWVEPEAQDCLLSVQLLLSSCLAQHLFTATPAMSLESQD